MSRLVLSFVFVLGFVLASTGLKSAPAHAGVASFAEATQEMYLGSEKAPVTLIEYASLGCPHCANFHHDVFPHIKKDYIDTGKVRMIYRDFPLGTSALAASMIARCAGPARFFGFIDIFFRSQAQWSRAENPLAALKKTARFGGMSPGDVDQCLSDQKLLENIQGVMKKAQDVHSVNSTPSFILDGETIAGGRPYDEFRALIEKALAKVK